MVVVAFQITIGSRAYDYRIREAFAGDGTGVISAATRHQLEVVRQQAPLGSRFVYVNAVPEEWQSRLWQRILYPDPVFIVQGVDQNTPRLLAELVRRERVTFVILAGRPPAEVPVVSRIRLPRYPKQKLDIDLGRLR